MKNYSFRRSFAFALLFGAASLSPAVALEPVRAHSWEITGLAQAFSSNASSAQFGSIRATAEFSSIRGGGVQAAYHLSESLAAHTYLWGGTGTFKASALGFTGTDELRVLEAGVGLDWHLLKGPFTPVIGAHAGYFNFSGGNTSGSESDFTFGASAGFRYDFNRHWFAKGVYRASWTQFSGFDNRSRIGGASLGIGYRF